MYFFDTHAIFEDIYGNPVYEKYKSFPFKVCILNIAEFYTGLLREYGEKIAGDIYNRFDFDILEVTEDIIIEAVNFKNEKRKERISLTDSVGYLLAKKYSLKFLTGDKFFENKGQVEFVK